MTPILKWARRLSAMWIGIDVTIEYGDPVAGFFVGVGVWAAFPWWGRVMRHLWNELLGRDKS